MKNQKGFSLIELLIVVVIIGIIAAIAIPNLLAARRSANEGSAISSIRVLIGAQTTYQTTVGNGRFSGDLGDLRLANIIDSTLGCDADPCAKSGYNFSIDTDNGVTGPGGYPPTWNAYAFPVTPSGVTQTGTRSFYSNEIGVIYYKSGESLPTEGITSLVRVPTNGTPLGNN